MNKLAVVFPGIGYNIYKPLLYYAGKIAVKNGYEVLNVEYRDLPYVDYSEESMTAAVEKAYDQVCEFLRNVDFLAYDSVVFIGKSIGTILAARYATEYFPKARLVLYTPLTYTYIFKTADAIAFLGDKDPFSDTDTVKSMSEEKGVPIYIYSGTNHSLESGDCCADINYLNDIMKHTADFFGKHD